MHSLWQGFLFGLGITAGLFAALTLLSLAILLFFRLAEAAIRWQLRRRKREAIIELLRREAPR
jgi:hypothetical protein